MKKNDFQSSSCEDRRGAAKEFLEQIPDGAVIGAGGSWTVSELGLLEGLSGRGHKILDHNKPDLSVDEKSEIRRSELTYDVFLTVTNVVTMDDNWSTSMA